MSGSKESQPRVVESTQREVLTTGDGAGKYARVYRVTTHYTGENGDHSGSLGILSPLTEAEKAEYESQKQSN